MKKLSQAVKTLLSMDNVEIFTLVRIDAPSGVKRYTSYFHDLTIEGNVYSADGLLKTVEPPSIADSVDREVYKIILAAPTSDNDTSPTYILRGDLEEGMTGRRVAVYVGFINTTQGTLNGAAPGTPLLNPSDLITSYKGWIDSCSITSDAVSGEMNVTFECVSPVGALDLVRGMRTNRTELRSRFSSDSAFDEVFVGSASHNLKWGKK